MSCHSILQLQHDSLHVISVTSKDTEMDSRHVLASMVTLRQADELQTGWWNRGSDTGTVFSCCRGCNLDTCMGSGCRGGSLPSELTWRGCVGRAVSLSLWCRAAWPQPPAARSLLWLTIVPALPFIQGPPSPFPSAAHVWGLRAQFLERVLTQSSGWERQAVPSVTPTQCISYGCNFLVQCITDTISVILYLLVGILKLVDLSRQKTQEWRKGQFIFYTLYLSIKVEMSVLLAPGSSSVSDSGPKIWSSTFNHCIAPVTLSGEVWEKVARLVFPKSCNHSCEWQPRQTSSKSTCTS